MTTTTTGTQRPGGARDRSFDALIASERTGAGATAGGFDRSDGSGKLLSSEQSSTRSSVEFFAVVVIVVVALIVVAMIALVTAPQQAAGAAPAEVPAEVTAASIAAEVELGWAEAGGSGSVTCPEPASQEPGTSIDCTAVYESAPLIFTAVIGDVAADEPRVLIASWSEAASG